VVSFAKAFRNEGLFIVVVTVSQKMKKQCVKDIES
jgi:hypothetical protein